jgi:hypothetical protein
MLDVSLHGSGLCRCVCAATKLAEISSPSVSPKNRTNRAAIGVLRLNESLHDKRIGILPNNVPDKSANRTCSDFRTLCSVFGTALFRLPRLPGMWITSGGPVNHPDLDESPIHYIVTQAARRILVRSFELIAALLQVAPQSHARLEFVWLSVRGSRIERLNNGVEPSHAGDRRYPGAAQIGEATNQRAAAPESGSV